MKAEMEFVWNAKKNQTPIIFDRKAKWQGIKIMHGNVLSGELLEFTPSYHEINITLSGQVEVCKQTAVGKNTYRCSEKDNVCITPFGQPLRAMWRNQIENLLIFFEPKFVEQIALENNFARGFEMTESYVDSDPLIQHLGLTLLYEIYKEEKPDKLYADTLTQSMVLHLLKNYSTADSALKEMKGGLSGYKLRLVSEYINDNLTDDLSLAEIAKVAGLSRYHFSRSFRKTTGMTPQQYLMQQRIERAKNLLENKKMPIVEVSLQTGFKNQSHFTTIFRKFTKLTPKIWRELRHA